jgi:hypothetical protein
MVHPLLRSGQKLLITLSLFEIDNKSKSMNIEHAYETMVAKSIGYVISARRRRFTLAVDEIK